MNMSIYLSGKIALLSMVATLTAWIQLTGNFSSSYPALFWASQVLFMLAIGIAMIFTLTHWDNTYNLSRKRMLLSLINILVLYGIAWTCSKYSLILILLCGMVEVYFIRKHLCKSRI